MAPRTKAARKRRTPNTGTIRYKKARALPWEAAFPLDKHQYRYDYFATDTEATAHLDRLAAERDHKETPRNVTGGSQRVETFLIAWLNIKEAYVKPKTFLDYQYQVVLACERIGALRLDEVTPIVADSLIIYYHKRGYQNVGQLKMVLRQAFKYAVKKAKYLRENPFDDTEVPHVERREGKAISIEERELLLAAATGDPYEELWHLYARLAFRRGEGLGARWSDVNWKTKTLTIKQQYTEGNGIIYQGTPKTPRSMRVVPLPDDILAMLRRRQDRMRFLASTTPGWQDNDLIFPGEKGYPLRPTGMPNRLKKLLRKASLPHMTIHDLRHTALFLLEQQGAPVSTRMALAGHTTPRVAGLYTDHATLEDVRRAISA